MWLPTSVSAIFGAEEMRRLASAVTDVWNIRLGAGKGLTRARAVGAYLPAVPLC